MSNHPDFMVYTEALEKVYQLGDEKIEVLKNVSLSIPKAKFIALTGASGSGKTTLLNIIGGIDRPSSGKIFVADQDLTSQNEDTLSDFRCNIVGFVFQSCRTR